ncbi:substrate-binding domain-containing protein [Chitinimonas sp. PSY-7]|uniref:substrate-binding domain-containing protein n=1 Tax=Chitinimonas sp. PSY-7 TaxID=3459088 RepID=UPI004040190E
MLKILNNIASLFMLLCLSLPSFAAAWDGPSSGPITQGKRKVIFLSQDLQNGGPTAAYRGLEEAAQVMGWAVSAVDGKGNTPTINTEFAAAIAQKPDAIVFGGFQAEDIATLLPKAKDAGIVLIGWHADAAPGPTKDLFLNIATHASDVARVAAEFVINSTKDKAGVVLINDDRFAVANEKTKRMKETLEQCKNCQVLSIENVLISKAKQEVEQMVVRLDKRFGKTWTHTLAINDIYFDEMNFPLTKIGRNDIRNISAGDGSGKALRRIKSGLSLQAATVAEPLNLQGWQLADELNRAFAGKPPSGFVTKPILVTTQSLARLGAREIDSDIPYKEAYIAIWKGTAGK